MADITQERRVEFKEASDIYKKRADEALAMEKSALAEMRKDPASASLKKLSLCETMIYVSTLYMAQNSLSLKILDVKSQDALNDARKALYKAIIYLEEVATNFIDTPYADLEKYWNAIAQKSAADRYYLIRKTGLAIQLLKDALGENSKWKWSFVELEGRFAAVAKNLMDMKAGAKSFFDPMSDDHEVMAKYVRMMNRLLDEAATAYRDRYELSTRRLDDMRSAIRFLLARRRLCIATGDSDSAEEIKKKAVVWKEKMDKDHKAGLSS